MWMAVMCSLSRPDLQSSTDDLRSCFGDLLWTLVIYDHLRCFDRSCRRDNGKNADVALQCHRRTDEGAGVAAAKNDAHYFPRQRLYDVADHSRTRHAGVTAWPADRVLLPAQCAAGDVMSALPPTGQARRLCHGQTATCKKFWTFKI